MRTPAQHRGCLRDGLSQRAAAVLPGEGLGAAVHRRGLVALGAGPGSAPRGARLTDRCQRQGRGASFTAHREVQPCQAPGSRAAAAAHLQVAEGNTRSAPIGVLEGEPADQQCDDKKHKGGKGAGQPNGCAFPCPDLGNGTVLLGGNPCSSCELPCFWGP